MGLDMNAYKARIDQLLIPDMQVNLEFKEDDCVIEIAYWRNFHHLQGWMEKLYRQKGGSGYFNCNSVRLMPVDLLQLALDAEVGLAATKGFFFGDGEWDEERKNEVLDFCVRAKKAIDDGYAVFYDSWW